MTITAIRPRNTQVKNLRVDTQAHVFAIWGPLGATGKSTIALNLAYEFALLGQRTILLDLDTYCPAQSQLLPIQDSSAGIAGAARLIRQGRFSAEELDRLSINVKHGRTYFRFLPGLTNPNRWSELTPETVQQLISVCNQNFDVIVIDVASNLEDGLTGSESATTRNCVARAAIKLSTKTVSVLAPTKVSVARYLNSFATLDELQKSRILILNGDTQNQQLSNAIRTLTKERVDAQVPSDEPAVQLSENLLLPLALARRRSAARNAIAALAHKLLV